MRAAMIQHSASGNETKSGEVSDPAYSRPATAVADVAVQTVWRAELPVPRAEAAEARIARIAKSLPEEELATDSRFIGN